MDDGRSPKGARVRQARKSLAHVPSHGDVGDKENATLDLSALSGSTSSKGKKPAMRSRSKSVGPGGMDALKEGSGNKGIPDIPRLKSILKPTIPSPSKAKSPQSPSRKASPSKRDGTETPTRQNQTTPSKGSARQSRAASLTPSKAPVPSISPARSPTRVALRTEEEQQAAAREKERQDALDQKEARRKSLASRRVSFAPEATLHTWNVIEMPEDSTTSSASTSSSRRASGGPGSPYAGARSPAAFDDSDPPSTPPEQVEETVTASPQPQRDLHQKNRRRSSTVPRSAFRDPEDFSSSPSTGESEDDTGTQAFETADEGSDSDSDDNDLVEDETVTNVDGDHTFHSTDSAGSSGRLDAALQAAARQAGTRGINYDEHGDMTMEMADDEVTNAFQPWTNKGQQQAPNVPSNRDDQENLDPFNPSPVEEARQEASFAGGEDTDTTMEMTQAIGGIVSNEDAQNQSFKMRRRKSMAPPAGRRSSVGRRKSMTDDSEAGDDETMDLTTAIGGIQNNNLPQADESENLDDEDEEMTMELTTVVGGVVQAGNAEKPATPKSPAGERQRRTSGRRQSTASEPAEDEADMDFTQSVGGILLPSITERTEPVEDQTMDMDMTVAGGAILPSPTNGSKTWSGESMEPSDAFAPQSLSSPLRQASPKKVAGAGLLDERPLPALSRRANIASETGSPSVTQAQAHQQARKSIGKRKSMAPIQQPPTPTQKPRTPTKQVTPKAERPTTPGKTPPLKNVTMRSASPKKLFEAEINSAKKWTPSPKKAAATIPYDPQGISKRLSMESLSRRRRSSGLGVDKEGLGSPHVTKLLDRRRSIGDNAKAFVPNAPEAAAVRFEDPRVMEQEIDKERAQDERRESGRQILEDEANNQDLGGRDATTSLKGMIESMTPQKKKGLQGRKSLHVGAAKGLLGKRPLELDEDGEDGDEETPKRLKNNKATPVKNVRLPAPPSKAETTGRVTRATGRQLTDVSGNARSSTPMGALTPSRQNTTPKGQGRFKDAEATQTVQVASFDKKVDGLDLAQPGEDDDRIHLQDFLNLTGIRFMELTTTKRRQTVAPNADLSVRKKGQDTAESNGKIATLEDCVVAGACTVPLLELYQHSCRELKNYIAEGRRVAKEIEDATYEDNPPLFREYLSAPADIKPVMDNQFRNVKANARLLSRALWYEWRMKLLDGLKAGLSTIGQGMEDDARSLTEQEQLLQPVLPGLEAKHEKLLTHVQLAQSQAEELASCDKEELRETRRHLHTLDLELEEKRAMVEELQNQLREQENQLEETLTQKQSCNDDILEAEKIRAECRGWSLEDVTALQAQVQTLETGHGWSILSLNEGEVSMLYKRSLELLFTPAAFRPNNSDQDATIRDNAPIRLTYVADSQEHNPQQLTTEKRFFLQIIRAQLQCLEQSEYSVKELLGFISSGWNKALTFAERIRLLDINYITQPSIVADEVMSVRSYILLKGMRTKVEADFAVKVQPRNDGKLLMSTSVKAAARVCYGEALNEKKMSEFLETRIKSGKEANSWAEAMRELEARLIARGKKA